jgi:hypothetical protein
MVLVKNDLLNTTDKTEDGVTTNGQQFNQYQQNEQSLLTSTHLIQKIPRHWKAVIIDSSKKDINNKNMFKLKSSTYHK